MELPIDLARIDLARIEEHLVQGIRRILAPLRYGGPDRYFEPGEPRPGDPGYFDHLDRIHDDFPRWLDPGEVTCPRRDDLEIGADGLLRFPSPLPPDLQPHDRVTVKLFPASVDAPATGVLFHHWLGLDGWRLLDWILSPLVERFRVAAMAAPHHLDRCRDGWDSGEGMVNPNPRHVLEGFRQWQADHLATLALLRRDHGFERIVVFGYSLGGYGALLHRLVRPPLPTVGLCVTNDYARGVFGGDRTAHLVERLTELGFTEASFHRATRSLCLSRWCPPITGEGLTLLWGRVDEIEPADSLRELRVRLAPDRGAELDGGHSTVLTHRQRIADEVAHRVRITARETAGEAPTGPSGGPGRHPLREVSRATSDAQPCTRWRRSTPSSSCTPRTTKRSPPGRIE